MANMPHIGLGSIPACAGEPDAQQVVHGDRTVYPRVCGGTQGLQRTNRDGNGLSPRVRGNPARAGAVFALLGSIPACAGEPASP